MNSWQEGIQRLGYQFLPFLIAVVVHEFGHGFVANYWGDSTAKDSGRLTLNPVPHIDPIGTLLFPMINMISGINVMFGWARPVPINPSRFRKYRPGLFWVSFAGPIANAVTAFLSALSLCLIAKYVSPEFIFFKELTTMLEIAVFINFGLGVFNLLPLPPLDGSKMIESFLSYNATRKYEQLAQYSFFILIALMMTGALRVLMGPILILSNLTLALASYLVG